MHSCRSQEEGSTLNKILALYSNEMLKISKRLSVWIVSILMLVIAVLCPIAFSRTESSFSDEHYDESYSKEAFTKRRDSLSQQLGDTSSFVQHSTVQYSFNGKSVELFSTYLDADEETVELYSSLTIYNTLLSSYDFDKYPIFKTWLSMHALLNYDKAHDELCVLNSVPFNERDEEWFKAFNTTSQLLEYASSALFNHNYQAYYESEKINIENYRDFYLPMIEKIISIDPQGELSVEETGKLEQLFNKIYTYQDELEYGLLSEGERPRIVTSAKREELQDTIAILNYKFEHLQTYQAENDLAHSVNSITIMLGRYCLIIILILIAGSSIAQEMATGSIKSLIIAPVRRWKIFLAKLLSIITWFIAGSVLLVGISTLVTLAIFGSHALPNYLFVSGGTIQSIPYFLYMILHFFVDSLPLFVYLMIAFMISCLTKNTGVAVGVSIGMVLSVNLPSLIISMFGEKNWIDLLPSSNMTITKRVFPFADLMYSDDLMISESFEITSHTLQFSLIYVAILIFILFMIAYDAFTKKDIQ